MRSLSGRFQRAKNKSGCSGRAKSAVATARNRRVLATGKKQVVVSIFDPGTQRRDIQDGTFKEIIMAQKDKALARPLSPFMHYRKGHTMTLSILHRMTGVALTVGSVLLVYWLVAAATGATAYAKAQEVFACWLTQTAMVAWIFSFFYHLLNGVRHLVWDTGRGFDLTVSRNSGYAVVVGSVALTALICAIFAMRFGGAA